MTTKRKRNHRGPGGFRPGAGRPPAPPRIFRGNLIVSTRGMSEAQIAALIDTANAMAMADKESKP